MILAIVFVMVSCNKIKETAKDGINKGGETVGKTATEFFEGVSEGVDKTLQCDIVLSQPLKDEGLETGKFSVENDAMGGKNNLLVLYVIFNKDLKKEISIKAFDKNGLEIGRTKAALYGKAGSASYHDFAFDKRTHIELRSKITLE